MLTGVVLMALGYWRALIQKSLARRWGDTREDNCGLALRDDEKSFLKALNEAGREQAEMRKDGKSGCPQALIRLFGAE